MKYKAAFILLLAMASSVLYAQPEDGRIYRLVNRYYPTLAATEDISTSGIVTRETGGDDAFEQMWRLDAKGTGYTLTNVLTGNAIAGYGSPNNQYFTSADGTAGHTFQLVPASDGYWNVRQATNMGGLHAAWTGKVVYWHDNAADATQWQLKEISHLSEEQLSLRQLVYKSYVDLTTHEADYNEALATFFTDGSCSELRPTYATMGDDELREAMSSLPDDFSRIALKVKNNAWGHREREFRIRDYMAYSDPEYWHEVLLTNRPGRINNPTGIYGNAGDIILVFVAGDIPQGATLQLEFIQGTSVEGSAVSLHSGLNVLTVALDESAFYIQYIGTTSKDDSRLITDYPPLRIHIENGIVNGFWNMAEHTDEDWVDILGHATASAIDVKGDKVMYHMHTSVMRQNCPRGIHCAIDWWENMLRWQHGIMGMEDYVPQKCNNMACAITLDDDHTYMAATWYRTQYHVNVAYKILDFNTVITDPDYCFGPAHENGHMEQGAINIVGCTESSNGVMENLVVWNIGKYLTRGPVMASVYNEYADGIPWVNRANDDMLRLQWQLYLYFHELGIDPTFWPRVFKAMRQTPLPIRYGGKREVTAAEDMLLFARTCCDVAQMDLTDFFAVYGYLVPHDKTETRESGNFLTTPQKDIDAFVAYASRYPKAPPIEFIDDRTRPIPRTDGGQGNRLTYDYGPGQCGDVGLYTDFIDTSVPAEGYIYSRTGSTIALKDGTGAIGFRIYHKDSGRLLYLSNSLRFTLLASCQSAPLRIVAVQSDGTEVRVPSTAEAGTEAEQLAALKSSLTTAKSVLDLRDDEGLSVGHLFGFALTGLQAIYDSALAARDNADQTVHTYGQWAMMLDEAVQEALADDEARVPVYSENIYALSLLRYRNYSLYYIASGPKGNTLDPTTNDLKHWQFVPTGKEGEYAIQNAANGLFITAVESDKRIRMQSDDIAQATHFAVKPNATGKITLPVCGTDLYLSYNDNKEAIGSRTADVWAVTTVVNHHAEALMSRADAYLRVAEYMYNDVISVFQNDGDTTDADIAILSDDFLTLSGRFFDARKAVIDLMPHPSEGRLDLLLDALWEAMEALSPTYCLRHLDREVRPYRGITDDGQGSWQGYYVYLQNLRTGTYAYYSDQSGRYEGCLRMGALTDPDDTRFQFYIERDDEGNHYLRNIYSGQLAALWSSYIDVSGGRDVVPFHIAFDEDEGGLLISGDEGYWTCQTSAGGYAQFRAKGTPWKLRVGGYNERMGIDTPTLQDVPDRHAPLYDLTGRRVSDAGGADSQPSPGIYIRQGRKEIHAHPLR